MSQAQGGLPLTGSSRSTRRQRRSSVRREGLAGKMRVRLLVGEEAEKATREAVKEASKAAEEERNGKKSEEPKEQVEVKADGSVH